MRLAIATLSLFALSLLGPVAVQAQESRAEAYPSRPITIIVPTSPGRTVDGSARLLAQSMSKALGQPVVIDNKPGAGGSLGIRMVAGAKPDGYTLIWYWSDALTLSPLAQKTPPFNPVDDFVHLGGAVRTGGLLIAANPTNVSATSLDALAKLAKTRQVSYSSYGHGSTVHLDFELLAERLAIQLLHVPYKSGTESENAALGGQVDLVSGVAFVPLLVAGRLRPLAVGGNARHPALPNVPTLTELGFGDVIFAPVTYGLAAPKGTPTAIAEKLKALLRTWVNDPDTSARMKAMNLEAVYSTPEEIVASSHQMTKVYSPVIKRLGIREQ